MSLLQGDVNKAKTAASLLLTMPGNPFIYNGEEIGMLGKSPDEFRREPFRWYPGNGEGETTWEAPRDNVGSTAVSVEAQTKDKDSLLSHYRELIRIRQSSPALMKGDFQDLPTGDSRIISYKRTYKEDSLLVLNNMSAETVTLKLSGEEYQGRKLSFSTSKNNTKVKHADKGLEITIPSHTTIGLE